MHCVELQRLAGARMKAAACWIAINEVAAFTAFNSRRRTHANGSKFRSGWSIERGSQDRKDGPRSHNWTSGRQPWRQATAIDRCLRGHSAGLAVTVYDWTTVWERAPVVECDAGISFDGGGTVDATEILLSEVCEHATCLRTIWDI